MRSELSRGEVWGIAQTLSGGLHVDPDVLVINTADLPPMAIDDIQNRLGINIGQLIGALSMHFGYPTIDDVTGNMVFKR